MVFAGELGRGRNIGELERVLALLCAIFRVLSFGHVRAPLTISRPHCATARPGTTHRAPPPTLPRASPPPPIPVP